METEDDFASCQVGLAESTATHMEDINLDEFLFPDCPGESHSWGMAGHYQWILRSGPLQGSGVAANERPWSWFDRNAVTTIHVLGEKGHLKLAWKPHIQLKCHPNEYKFCSCSKSMLTIILNVHECRDRFLLRMGIVTVPTQLSANNYLRSNSSDKCS